MGSVRMSWRILILAITLGCSEVEATDVDKCTSSYVDFNSTLSEEIQCQWRIEYDFNDGDALSVKANFENGHYNLVLEEPKKFTIQDRAGCLINDLGNRVHALTIYLPPDFNSPNGCGISVSGSYLWGAIVLHTENDLSHNGKPKDTGRVIFPLQKTAGISDINSTTINSILLSDGAFVDLDVSQLHKLGSVSSSQQAYGYLFYSTVVKMYADVPIRISEEAYDALVVYDTPTVAEVEECQNVFKLLGNGSLIGNGNAMLVTTTSLLVWCVNWAFK